MQYHHSFLVNKPLEDVSRFHMQSVSMGAITPPPVIVQVHHAPQILQEGDEMDFTLWLGPLPIHWLARIEAVTEQGFKDRQMRGPFEFWEHEHIFVPIHTDQTEINDIVHFDLKRHPIWFFIGLGFALSLPILFAYRTRKTRQLLQKVRKQSVKHTNSSDHSLRAKQ